MYQHTHTGQIWSSDPLFIQRQKVKYLGHINKDMPEADDVNRKIKALYVRGNILCLKFFLFSSNVK